MSATASIALTAEQRQIVAAILRRHLPAGTKIGVFGSRAANRAKLYSDLDLAIDAGRTLSLDETGALREAFSQSDLPWKVDLVDWRDISGAFREVVAASQVPLMVVA